jgi:hypothetical protein
MPQSFTSLHYHLVFSTKYREPTITPQLRPRLYDYLGGIVRGEGGVCRPFRGSNHYPAGVQGLAPLANDRRRSAAEDMGQFVRGGASCVLAT